MLPHYISVSYTHLYQIDDKFYRSEQLEAQSEALLNKLNIHTIVNLRFFDRNDDKQAFGHTKINLINTPLLTWSISPDEVADILWQIKQHQKNGSVLVHCYHCLLYTSLAAEKGELA